MSTYKCTNCNYATRDKSNFSKHENSKKHVEKVNQKQYLSSTYHVPIIDSTLDNEFRCGFCNNVYTNSGNLSRHKTACLEKKTLIDEFKLQLLLKDEMLKQKDETLKQKDETLKQIDESLKRADETISVLKSEVVHLKAIVNNTGSIIKTSVSTMAYVIKNYKDAPALESIKDYSAIRYEQDNTEFVENLIYEHNNNKLHIYISDFIIKTYKKDDPTKQSLWNSDTSRLTYLIREIITNNKVDWKVDKKGIKTGKFIIEPILEYIDNQIRNYVQSYEVDHRISAKEAERQMMTLKSGMEIIKSIETKILSEEILKYITPHFYLTKDMESIDPI